MQHVLVSCGTYDGAVFALCYSYNNKKPLNAELLKPVFIDPTAHIGSVEVIAAKDDVVLSGSKDEVIQIYSIRTRSRLGALELHTGTIKYLEFTENLTGYQCHHLLSASDDGCIAIWRRKHVNFESENSACPSAWECIRQLRRHKGPVRSVSIHPSNKVALSISDDKTLRVWNLLRGRQAYAVRLKNFADDAKRVSFSPSGKRLLLDWPNRFDVIEFSQLADVSEGKRNYVIGSIEFQQTITAAPVFFSENDQIVYVLVGVGPMLSLVKIPCSPEDSDKKLGVFSQLKLPGNRIKSIVVLPWPSNSSENDSFFNNNCRLVVIYSTDADASYIRGYGVNLTNESDKLEYNENVIPMFTYDVNSIRITSMSACWCSEELLQPHA